MIKIDYPEHSFNMKAENDKEFIFDEFRKLWVRLTPEEWVRQNILQYLVKVQQYPASLMAIEKEIVSGELKKRCDIVVYKDARPWMIVECKEMNVPLSEHVLRQALHYNIPLSSNYICITNGSHTYLWQLHNGQAVDVAAFPAYKG